MNYGTSNYGSTTIGGANASEWFTFFVYQLRVAGSYESELEFTGTAPLISLFSHRASDEISVELEAFTRNGPDDTPQSQGTFSGFSVQHVIPAARFIKVRATLSDLDQLFSVRGRPGD